MKHKNSHIRIAFLGGGAHTPAAYRKQLNLLAQKHDLTLYSEFHISEDKAEYMIKSVPSWKVPRRIREIWFGLMIFFDLLIEPVDIIHTHSTFPSGLAGILIGRLLSKPVIVSLDAGEGVALKEIGFGDLLHKKRTKVNRYVLRQSSIITALTEYHKQSIVENLGIKKEIKVIPRGVDISRFKFSNNTISCPVQFLSVGYISTVKDQETLLRCLALLKDKIPCHLTHFGEDYEDGKLQKLCDELGITSHVSFKGFVSNDEIHQYYKDADILLHTSLFESQAVVVAEALASGALVCGTHVGLMADLADSCTLTFKPGDYEELATGVIKLLGDDKKIKQMRANGRKWAEEHDIEWTCKKYQEIYDKLIW